MTIESDFRRTPEQTPSKTYNFKDIVSSVEQNDGLKIEVAEVGDEHDDMIAEYAAVSERFKYFEDILGDDDLPPQFHPETGTVNSFNEVASWIYGSPDDPHRRAVQQWGNLMPSARALYSITHLDNKYLPAFSNGNLVKGEYIPKDMQTLLVTMEDCIGIRTRKRLAKHFVIDSLRDKLSRTTEPVQCTSLACGAADLMVESTKEASRDSLNQVHFNLVDIDDESLALARHLASQEGLEEDVNYTIYDSSRRGNLLRHMILRGDFVDQLGEESQQVVEAIGINEYFSDRYSTMLLKNAWRLVAPGGIFVTANMRSDRSQLNVNRKGIGWTDQVQPRSLDEFAKLLKGAGLPADHIRLVTPMDGVYTVAVVTKPTTELATLA